MNTPEDTLSKTIHTPKGNPIVLDLTKKRINLTDLWRAIGSPESKRPVDWLRSDLAQSLATYVAEQEKVVPDHLYVINPGRGGSTWANWHLGLAYAKYLSVRFHVWCNEVIRAVMTSTPVPPPAPPPPSSGDTVSFKDKVAAAALLQEHLLRVQKKDSRLTTACLNSMSEAWSLIWKMPLPILEEEEGAPPVENEDAEPPPPSKPVQPPVEAVGTPKEGEVLKAVPVAPGEVPVALQAERPGWGTGNAVAEWIDQRYGMLMSRYVLKGAFPVLGGDVPRKTLGGKFNDLMRVLKRHPRASKGYTPAPPSMWGGYADLISQPYQVSPNGETKVREEVRFSENAMALVVQLICNKMGVTLDQHRKDAVVRGFAYTAS